jgi:hypothetical protein
MLPIRKEKDMIIYWIYKDNHPIIPKEVVTVVADLGYLGIDNYYPVEQLSVLPYKKKRNQPLSEEEERGFNKFHSRKRIVIEHTICRLKKYKIVRDVFRNKLMKKYDKVSDIRSCLVNYRIMKQRR